MAACNRKGKVQWKCANLVFFFSLWQTSICRHRHRNHTTNHLHTNAHWIFNYSFTCTGSCTIMTQKKKKCNSQSSLCLNRIHLFFFCLSLAYSTNAVHYLWCAMHVPNFVLLAAQTMSKYESTRFFFLCFILS